jgi:hypothetical protein
LPVLFGGVPIVTKCLVPWQETGMAMNLPVD